MSPELDRIRDDAKFDFYRLLQNCIIIIRYAKDFNFSTRGIKCDDKIIASAPICIYVRRSPRCAPSYLCDKILFQENKGVITLQRY